MIRSFDWRDVGLVKTLADRGICLDSETGLTQGNHPLQYALVSYLMPMASAPTFIWRADGDQGALFGQLRHRQGDEHAWILYMAPAAQNGTDGWQPMIERLAVEAGERRAQNLIAEVNEKSPEFEALRRAGFAIYARHNLWKLPTERAAAPPAEAAALRPATRADAVAVNNLYCNVVPRLVQQVVPGPQHIERGYVLQDGDELVAYLDVRRGPQGTWVEPFLHPEAYDRSDTVLQAALQLLTGRDEKPLVVCVRRYQDWLQDVVARAGFVALGSQAVMVKRLVVRLAEPVLKSLSVVEGPVPTPITSAHYQFAREPRNRARLLIKRKRYRWHTYAKANH